MVSFRRKLALHASHAYLWWLGIIGCCSAVLLASPACAQTQWEFSPYQVQLAIVSSADSHVDVERFSQRLLHRAEALVGAGWRIEVVTLPDTMKLAVLADAWPTQTAELPEAWLTADKILILRIDQRAARLTAVEFDTTTRIWSPRLQRDVPQTLLLDGTAMELLLDVFSPLGRIDSVNGKQVVLRMRGGALPVRDSQLQLLREQDILLPVFRFLDREGVPRRIAPLDWTFLQVDEVDGAAATTTVYSGLRSPLSARTRGRVDRFALAIPQFSGSTILELRSSSESDSEPLVGYSVYSQAPEQKLTELLGQTGRDGELTIPPAESFLRLLLIKHGDEVLARLPMIPGLHPRLNAQLPEDDDRLHFEGVVIGLQETLVDLVTRREVLISQIRGLIAAGKVDEAGTLVSQIREIRNQQERFMLGLEEKRRQVRTSDPRMRARVERLFNDTKSLMAQYFDEGPLTQLEAEYAEARRNRPATSTAN